MPRRIVLLTGHEEAPFFKDILLERNPRLDVTAAFDLEELAAAVDRYDGDVRLIAFLTSVIVPPALLSRLQITPYNIHPAPPEYPGSNPESFAIWDGAPSYGVKAHEMTARVENGPIVAVYRFAMPPTPDRIELSKLVYARAIKVFAVVAAHCAETDEAMPPMEAKWATEKRTRRQFRALCLPPDKIAPGDLERLRRACGDDFTERGPAQS